MRLNVKGKLSISRPSYGDGREEIVIKILDDAAGDDILHIHIPLDNFAKALTGQGRLDCMVDTSYEQLRHVGTILETKTVFVPGEYGDDKGQALAPFCVYGWKPCHGDFGNHHCSVNNNGVWGFNVKFVRNVPTKKEQGDD